MAKKAVQDEMFRQKKVPLIEKWADAYDDARDRMNTAKGEMGDAELKLSEAMHANEAYVQMVPGKRGTVHLVYQRTGYTVKVKQGRETVNVKLTADAKGAPAENNSGDVEGGE
jgi:hypothetical protein